MLYETFSVFFYSYYLSKESLKQSTFQVRKTNTAHSDRKSKLSDSIQQNGPLDTPASNEGFKSNEKEGKTEGFR